MDANGRTGAYSNSIPGLVKVCELENIEWEVIE